VLTPQIAALVPALQAGGFTGPVVTTGYAPELVGTDPATVTILDSEYLFATEVPAEQDTPWNHRLRDDLAATGTQDISLAAVAAYGQADLLLALLDSAGPDLDTGTLDESANGGGSCTRRTSTAGPERSRSQKATSCSPTAPRSSKSAVDGSFPPRHGPAPTASSSADPLPLAAALVVG
jgi:hypothetical protein